VEVLADSSDLVVVLGFHARAYRQETREA
jgi:hypothetical protein